MSLTGAFRIKSGDCLAFSGAGGKTTAIFHLAREIQQPVVVSTTTHFAVDQLSLADKVIQVKSLTEIDQSIENIDSGVTLLFGDETHVQRVKGLSDRQLERVFSLTRDRGIPLLIEADGSRMKPAKAPAEHEPAIPHFVDGVVVVFGLSSMGKPLTEEWIHRMPQYAELTGLQEGDQISAESALRSLVNPQGGLKNIPPGARRYCLLNQADTLREQAQGNRIARALIPPYDSCAVASLLGRTSPEESVGEQDENDANMIHAVHEPVYGIILAAGGSKRMGRTKQLLPWRGEPIIRHIARATLKSDFAGVAAVLGSESDLVREALLELPVEIIENPAWQEGQSTSVRVGLKHLPKGAGGAVFLLADQPLIPATLMRALIDRRARTLAPIVVPLVDGRRGNPVLFGWQTFNDLGAVHGDRGGRALFSKYPLEYVEWHDATILKDIDHPEDYQRLLSMSEE